MIEDLIKREWLIVTTNFNDKVMDTKVYKYDGEEKELEIYQMEITIYLTINGEVKRQDVDVEYAFTDKFKEYISICNKKFIPIECWDFSIVDTKIVLGMIVALEKVWIITTDEFLTIQLWVEEILRNKSKWMNRDKIDRSI